MATSSGYEPGTDVGGPSRETADGGSGYGWLVFAGIILGIAGTLNIIYGIAAIGDSKFFAGDTHFVLSNLNTWGWVTLILGVLQLAAAFSLWAGGAYGRVFGIAAASLSMIGSLMSIPAYPLWSLCIFGIDILIIYGLATYDPDRAR